MDDDDCCGSSNILVNNQHQHCSHHGGESGSSVAFNLVQLLLCLPALRQADQLIRQYWTRVHRDNQQQLATDSVQLQQQSSTVSVAGNGGFSRQSSAADRLSSSGNVKMNKLFVEMLEACLR